MKCSNRNENFSDIKIIYKIKISTQQSISEAKFITHVKNIEGTVAKINANVEGLTF